MRLLVDECVERSIVEHLRDAGFAVDAVAELSPGASDSLVLDLANEREAPLLTCDKDFGELIFRQGRLSHGIILIRLHGLSGRPRVSLSLRYSASIRPRSWAHLRS